MSILEVSLIGGGVYSCFNNEVDSAADPLTGSLVCRYVISMYLDVGS